MSITAILPLARPHTDKRMSGGGVHTEPASEVVSTCSRYACHATKSARRSIPITNKAIMSVEQSVEVASASQGKILHDVFQPFGAMLPSLRTKTMKTRPPVTSTAPSQSTRLSPAREHRTETSGRR